MKLIAIPLSVAIVVAGSADARGRHAHLAAAAFDNGDYTNVSGDRVHRPVHSRSAPAGAAARCADGSFSFSEHHRGTCSHHGGVASWLR